MDPATIAAILSSVATLSSLFPGGSPAPISEGIPASSFTPAMNNSPQAVPRTTLPGIQPLGMVNPAGASNIPQPGPQQPVKADVSNLRDIEDKVQNKVTKRQKSGADIEDTEAAEAAGKGSLSDTLMSPNTLQSLAALIPAPAPPPPPAGPINIQSRFNPAGVNPFDLSQRLALQRRR